MTGKRASATVILTALCILLAGVTQSNTAGVLRAVAWFASLALIGFFAAIASRNSVNTRSDFGKHIGAISCLGGIFLIGALAGRSEGPPLSILDLATLFVAFSSLAVLFFTAGIALIKMRHPPTESARPQN